MQTERIPALLNGLILIFVVGINYNGKNVLSYLLPSAFWQTILILSLCIAQFFLLRLNRNSWASAAGHRLMKSFLSLVHKKN